MDLKVHTFNWLCEASDRWEVEYFFMENKHYLAELQAPCYITIIIFVQQIMYIQKIGTPFLLYFAALGVNFQKMSRAIQNLQILPIA
jgi:hypothetical protein